MTKPEDYAYRVFWSQQDDAYIATVAEFPSLSCVEETQADAFFGIVAVVGTLIFCSLVAGILLLCSNKDR